MNSVYLLWVYSAVLYIALPIYTHVSIFTFILPLIFSIKRLSKPSLFVFSLLYGLFIDLFDSSVSIGTHSCMMGITAFLTLKVSPFFFKEKLSSVFFLGLFISIIVTLQTFLIHAIFQGAMPLNIYSCLSEMMIYPLLDSFFCLFHIFLFRMIMQYKVYIKRRLAHDRS